MPCINSFDKNWLKKIIGKIKYLFFLEDHNISGGFADLIVPFMIKNKIFNNQVIKKIGPNEFPACGTPDEVLKYHKIDHVSIASKIKKTIFKDK